MPIATIIEQSDPGLNWIGDSPGYFNTTNQQNIWEVPGRDARYVAVRRLDYQNDLGSFTTYCSFYKTTDDINFSVLDFSNAPTINTDGDMMLTDKPDGSSVVSFVGDTAGAGGGPQLVHLGLFDLVSETYGTILNVSGAPKVGSGFEGGRYIKLFRLADGTHGILWQCYFTDLAGNLFPVGGQTYNTLFVSHIDASGTFSNTKIVDRVANPNPLGFTTSFLNMGSFAQDSRDMSHFSYSLSEYDPGTCDVRYNNVQYNGGGSFTVGTPVSFVKIQINDGAGFGPPPQHSGIISNDATCNLRGLYYAPQDKAFLPHLFGGASVSGTHIVSGSWPKNISMITVNGAATSPSPVFEGISDTSTDAPPIADGLAVFPAIWVNGACLYYACQIQGFRTSPPGGIPSTRTRIWTRGVAATSWQTPGIDWWVWSTDPPNAGPNVSTPEQDSSFPDMQVAPIKNGAALANVWSFDVFRLNPPFVGVEIDVCLFYISGGPPQSCSGVIRVLSAPEKIVRRGAMGFRI